MKNRNIFSLLLTAIILFSSGFFAIAAEKPRVIVLTDIGEDPDDEQSLVRFLLYSYDFDVEGLIATTALWMKGNKDGEPVNPAPKYIHEIIDAYEQVEDNLRSHSECFPRAADYPTAEFFRERTFAGNYDLGMNQDFGMGDVGEGLSSAGSNHIIEVLEKDDERPVWVLIWGGANTLAQAVFDIDNSERSDAEKQALFSKIRAYDIAGQDDAGGWIAYNFPKIYYMRSVYQYRGMAYKSCYDTNRESFIYDSEDCPKPPGQYCCRVGDEQGGVPDIFTPGWIDTHIKQAENPLAEVYPRKGSAWSEGQSPTFLFLVNNGLSNPDSIAWGGWGGRFKREKGSAEESQIDENYILKYDFEKDYRMYVPARDWAYTPKEEKFTHNRLAPVFRWREAMTWDFKARMDWAFRDVESTNHNPVIKLRNHQSGDALYLNAPAGDTLSFDASASSDPDEDALGFQWWVYDEAGFYNGEADFSTSIIGEDLPQGRFVVPEDAKQGDVFHLILELTDAGSPVLKTYQRFVITVNESTGSIHPAKKSELKIFPNPATEELHVTAPAKGLLAVTDKRGRRCLTKQTNGNDTVLNIWDLKTGIYILSFFPDYGGIVSERFSKQ